MPDRPALGPAAIVLLAGGRALRFPGKLEHLIGGEPMVPRVCRACALDRLAGLCRRQRGSLPGGHGLARRAGAPRPPPRRGSARGPGLRRRSDRGRRRCSRSRPISRAWKAASCSAWPRPGSRATRRSYRSTTGAWSRWRPCTLGRPCSARELACSGRAGGPCTASSSASRHDSCPSPANIFRTSIASRTCAAKRVRDEFGTFRSPRSPGRGALLQPA